MQNLIPWNFQTSVLNSKCLVYFINILLKYFSPVGRVGQIRLKTMFHEIYEVMIL